MQNSLDCYCEIRKQTQRKKNKTKIITWCRSAMELPGRHCTCIHCQVQTLQHCIGRASERKERQILSNKHTHTHTHRHRNADLHMGQHNVKCEEAANRMLPFTVLFFFYFFQVHHSNVFCYFLSASHLFSVPLHFNIIVWALGLSIRSDGCWDYCYPSFVYILI